jgi:hypothetical protein
MRSIAWAQTVYGLVCSLLAAVLGQNSDSCGVNPSCKKGWHALPHGASPPLLCLGCDQGAHYRFQTLNLSLPFRHSIAGEGLISRPQTPQVIDMQLEDTDETGEDRTPNPLVVNQIHVVIESY